MLFNADFDGDASHENGHNGKTVIPFTELDPQGDIPPMIGEHLCRFNLIDKPFTNNLYEHAATRGYTSHRVVSHLPTEKYSPLIRDQLHDALVLFHEFLQRSVQEDEPIVVETYSDGTKYVHIYDYMNHAITSRLSPPRTGRRYGYSHVKIGRIVYNPNLNIVEDAKCKSYYSNDPTDRCIVYNNIRISDTMGETITISTLGGRCIKVYKKWGYEITTVFDNIIVSTKGQSTRIIDITNDFIMRIKRMDILFVMRADRSKDGPLKINSPNHHDSGYQILVGSSSIYSDISKLAVLNTVLKNSDQRVDETGAQPLFVLLSDDNPYQDTVRKGKPSSILNKQQEEMWVKLYAYIHDTQQFPELTDPWFDTSVGSRDSSYYTYNSSSALMGNNSRNMIKSLETIMETKLTRGLRYGSQYQRIAEHTATDVQLSNIFRSPDTSDLVVQLINGELRVLRYKWLKKKLLELIRAQKSAKLIMG